MISFLSNSPLFIFFEEYLFVFLLLRRVATEISSAGERYVVAAVVQQP